LFQLRVQPVHRVVEPRRGRDHMAARKRKLLLHGSKFSQKKFLLGQVVQQRLIPVAEDMRDLKPGGVDVAVRVGAEMPRAGQRPRHSVPVQPAEVKGIFAAAGEAPDHDAQRIMREPGLRVLDDLAGPEFHRQVVAVLHAMAADADPAQPV
jgi:hypothetical protein